MISMRIASSHVQLTLSLAAGLVCIGCGKSGPYELAPVSGVVTLDGKPVPYTRIVFVPKGSEGKVNPGPGSTALCDDAGHFELETVRGEPGAVVGSHAVQVSATGPQKPPSSSDTNSGPPPKDAFPPQFNTNSTLTFDVPAEGTTTANFELKSTP
jgi:hypothetical protein